MSYSLDPLKMRIRCNGVFLTSIITCMVEGHIIQGLKEKRIRRWRPENKTRTVMELLTTQISH